MLTKVITGPGGGWLMLRATENVVAGMWCGTDDDYFIRIDGTMIHWIPISGNESFTERFECEIRDDGNIEEVFNKLVEKLIGKRCNLV